MSKLRLYEWLNPKQPAFDSPDVDMDVPKEISNNLKHELREYQKQSLRNTIYMLDSNNADAIINNGFQNKHLLYNMATGSGKTIVMASLILYLYHKFNYQYFIFFVNSDAVIQKTKENMFNKYSSKYLFDPKGITMDGNKVIIESVNNFPAIPLKNTIYLKLTTIHGLHNDMNENTYKENSLTYEDLKEMNVILLGDEAHHYNSLTKSKKLSKTDIEEQTWENTIQKILYANIKNKLFEFTATLNMSDKNISEKYSDKIVYSYDLRRYMEDGFSKNVMRLQSDTDDDFKMMDAMYLSQYRKIIALKNGIVDFKPIVMFKSNKIIISNEKEMKFNEIVENLNIDNAVAYFNKRIAFLDENNIMYKVYNFYLNHDNLVNVIDEIKNDFSSMNILNANKNETKVSGSLINEKNAVLLNTLEERDNPIRAIFAVAKLNEGWDVLNLFDIVRIGETASITINATDSEAQLIGRGARYFPFIYDGNKSQIRRFDNTADEMRILEELHYHTTNDSKYLNNLHKSLDTLNLISETEGDKRILTATLKYNFKKSYVYNNRSLFVNKKVETTEGDFNSLEDYAIERNYLVDKSILGLEEGIFDNEESEYALNVHQQPLKVDIRYIKKAMQRNPFYQFNNLKEYIPILNSKKELLESENFFGNISINVKLPISKHIDDLDSSEKLAIIDKYLGYCADKFKGNYKKEKGTEEFDAIKIKDVVKDYSIVSNINKTDLNQHIIKRDKNIPEFYIYKEAVMNELEYSLLDYINSFYQTLKKKYKIVYLIRNDERNSRITLREFDGIRGFMPDFILYLEDNNYIYQVFIEPKGEHLVLQDKWKEEMLDELRIDEIMVLDDNKEVKISGTKFYKKYGDQEFIDSLSDVINDGKPLIEKDKLF